MLEIVDGQSCDCTLSDWTVLMKMINVLNLSLHVCDYSLAYHIKKKQGDVYSTCLVGSRALLTSGTAAYKRGTVGFELPSRVDNSTSLSGSWWGFSEQLFIVCVWGSPSLCEVCFHCNSLLWVLENKALLLLLSPLKCLSWPWMWRTTQDCWLLWVKKPDREKPIHF